MQIDQLIGQQISAYRVEEKIGQGGMATVYRAYQPSVDRSIALKVISLDPSEGRYEEFRQRFEQEAKVIAALEHIHILPIYDYGIVNERFAYIAMRLLRGGTLSDLLVNAPLDMERSADLLTQIARGLSYAHSKGILHRDLKPSNILLDESGNAFLSDFGLAKLTDNPMIITRTDVIVGTPAYMSPEQLRGETLDARSDNYSLGVILYHMLTGKPPFEATDKNVVSVIYQHLEKQPEPPSSLNPLVTEQIDEIVLKALSKSPEDRFETANDLATAFNLALGRSISTGNFPVVRVSPSVSPRTSQPVAVTPMTLDPQSQSTTRRTTMAVGGGVLVLLLVAIVLYGTGVLSPPMVFHPPTVLQDQTGIAADAVPTDEEIRIARARVGSNGFIAYAACVQSSQYHAAQAREIAGFAAQYGLPFRIYNADNDAYVQQTQIEQARTEGVTGMIVCPLDINLLDDTLTDAEHAGLPLVFMAAEIKNYGGVLLAGDDYLMGKAAGHALGQMIADERGGNANIIILDFPNMPQVVTRANGLEDGVKEVVPEVNIIGRFLGGTRADGEESVKRLLDDGVQFDAILSINDAGSYGAIEALTAAGVSPDAVMIGSIDAEDLAREYISRGYFIRLSVDVGREEFSRSAVNVLIKLLAGATLPETLLVPPGETITRDTLPQATEDSSLSVALQ